MKLYGFSCNNIDDCFLDLNFTDDNYTAQKLWKDILVRRPDLVSFGLTSTGQWPGWVVLLKGREKVALDTNIYDGDVIEVITLLAGG